MKCKILFPGKNISKYCLLKILPRVLSVRQTVETDQTVQMCRLSKSSLRTQFSRVTAHKISAG